MEIYGKAKYKKTDQEPFDALVTPDVQDTTELVIPKTNPQKELDENITKALALIESGTPVLEGDREAIKALLTRCNKSDKKVTQKYKQKFETSFSQLGRAELRAEDTLYSKTAQRYLLLPIELSTILTAAQNVSSLMARLINFHRLL